MSGRRAAFPSRDISSSNGKAWHDTGSFGRASRDPYHSCVVRRTYACDPVICEASPATPWVPRGRISKSVGPVKQKSA